jgi:hypothetical protein
MFFINMLHMNYQNRFFAKARPAPDLRYFLFIMLLHVNNGSKRFNDFYSTTLRVNNIVVTKSHNKEKSFKELACHSFSKKKNGVPHKTILEFLTYSFTSSPAINLSAMSFNSSYEYCRFESILITYNSNNNFLNFLSLLLGRCGKYI